MDHVIPWSFLLEEDLWDLVLACGKCNSGKSDSLPPRQFIEKLIHRNKQLFNAGISLAINESEVTRLYEAAISVEWPQFLGKMKEYNKLVRDRIPEIIEQAGKIARWHQLNDDEFREALRAKVVEEAIELLEADDAGICTELADLAEVLDAALRVYGVSPKSWRRSGASGIPSAAPSKLERSWSR